MIEFLKKLIQLKNKTIIKYLFVSVIATCIDVGLLFLLTEFLKINYLISGTISYCVGIIIGYIGQKTLTFNDKNTKICKQFAIFTIVSLIGLLINLVILKIFVEYFGLHYLISK
jgi:putative flippase GtrA